MPDLLAPHEFADLIESEDFKSLPFEDRNRVFENGARESAQYISENEGWDPETFKGWRLGLQNQRNKLTASETLGEKAGAVASTIGTTLKDSGMAMLTTAAGLLPVIPKTDGQGNVTGLQGQIPGETLLPMLGQNLAKLNESVGATRVGETQSIDTALEAIRNDIDAGNFPLNDPTALGTWLDERQSQLSSLQRDYYKRRQLAPEVIEGMPQEAISQREADIEPHLSANQLSAHTQAFQDYLLTGRTSSWDALRKGLLTTPEEATINRERDRLSSESKLANALSPQNTHYIQEAADPAELAGNIGAIGSGGATVAAKGLLKKAANVAIGGIGEGLSELVSQHMDDPHATAGERWETFKQAMIGSLGLAGVGAAAKGITSIASNPSPQQGNVTEGSPTETPGSYPVAEVSGDAGSTPAVAANNLTLHQANLLAGLVRNVPGVDPTQVGQVTLRIAPQIQWNEDATLDDLQSQVTQALSEPTIPVATAVAEDSSVSAPTVGPTSLMDVANRAGRIDAPRLQMSKKPQPLKGTGKVSFNQLEPGDYYSAIADVRPEDRANDTPPKVITKLPKVAINAVETMLAAEPVVADPDGQNVLLDNPDYLVANVGNPRRGRAAHLTGDKNEATNERIFNPSKAAWARAVPNTIKDYDYTLKHGSETIYVRWYGDKRHMVVTGPSSAGQAKRYVKDHGEINLALITQRPALKSALKGATLTKVRRLGVAGSSANPTQAPSETTPQAALQWNPASDARVGNQSDPQASSTDQTYVDRIGPRLNESKPKPGTPLNTLVKNTRAVAQQAARLLNQQLPGIVGSKLTFVANPAELLASNYAAENSFTAEEVAQMQDAEGFFDNDTGHTIIFTDSIEVRPGESERAAVARVILHERVGHDGFNALYQNDPDFAAAWDAIASKIPEGDINDIIHDGYEHLAADRHQVALEWFARQVEQRMHLKEGLARRAWLALRNLINRIRAPFAKSEAWAHESDLINLINKARDAALNGTAVPTTADGMRLQFALGGTRVFEQGYNRPFRVNNLGLRTILTGSALPRAFHETVQATERQRRALDQVAAQIGLDLKSAIEAHAKTTNQPLAKVYDLVHQAMNGAPGTNSVLLAIDPTLAEHARVARNFIDDMSVAIANTLPRGELRTNIILNQGAWMRRQYAVFDANSSWNFDNVMQAARDGKPVGTKQARAIVKAAAAYISNQNGYSANQRDAKGLPRVGSVLEADLRDLMDRDNMSNLLMGSAAVRKNVSSLISRKEIPSVLRELMGEETNPLKQFLGSTGFQAQFLQRHQQQIALRNIGLANNLFVTNRAGVFTKEIPTDNPRWSPLAGLYTTPQLWEALQKVDGTQQGNVFWDLTGKALQWLGSEAKLNKVAMNPDSWVVNAAGGIVALVQTGDVFSFSIFSRIAKAMQLYKAGKASKADVGQAAANAALDMKRATIARLTADGVLGNSLTSRDLEASMDRSLLQWVELEEQTIKDRAVGAVKGAIYGNAAGRSLGVVGRVVGGAVGAVGGATMGNAKIRDLQARLADIVMTAPDTVARLTGFLGNLETAHAAGLKGDAAHTYAVERTRNTFPDYSKLPAILRTLSKYGFAGSFVAFQWEVYRNTYHNLRYAKQDLLSANPAMQVRGAKRLIGASMIGYLAAGGMQALFQGAAGTDDDRNRKWRKWFAAPWEKNAILAFTSYNPESVTYFNTSYLLPQTTIAELAVAASTGDDPAEVAGNLVNHSLEQFFGASVHLKPLMEAMMNQDRAGRDITHRDGSFGGVADKLEHVAKATLEPGWTQKVERLIYAYRDAERRGRKFSFEEEFARFVGIRSFTRTWPDMVKRRFDTFTRDYAAVRNEANETLAQNLPGAKSKAITTASAKIQELSRLLAEYEADLPRLGVPKSIIETARKDSTVPTKFRLLEIDPQTANRVRSVK
jgi:hypothetical protein